MPLQIDIADPLTRGLFKTLDGACADVPCSYLLVGAFARDLICQHLYNLTPRRLTEDIDIGVMVESWNDSRSVYRCY